MAQFPISSGPDARASVPGAGAAPALDEPMLLERIARHDRAAFDVLYRRYFSRLSRFLGRMIRRPQLVGEVVNDTMLVVWRKAGSYNGQSRVSTWIFAIAYRTALKAIGRQQDGCGVDVPEAESPEESSPERILMRMQDRRILDAAMQGLSAEHRAVIELTYFHDCACRDVALIVGCPVDTVKTRLFHARRRLKALLSTKAEDLR